MRILLLIGLLLISVLSHGQKLRVAIASSLLLPFQEIKEEFTKQENIDVDLIAGSSGSLTTQIVNGAPYDLFISANHDFPDLLFNEGLALKEPEVLFNGQVYLWSKSAVGDDIPVFISDGGYQRIAIANPELAPYGTTAKDWLERRNLWDKVESKMIFGNAISQVNHYISTNAVDVAFSSNSAAYSSQLKSFGNWYRVEGADIALVPYFLVVISSSNTQSESESFVKFLTGDKAEKVLVDFGFVMIH